MFLTIEFQRVWNPGRTKSEVAHQAGRSLQAALLNAGVVALDPKGSKPAPLWEDLCLRVGFSYAFRQEQTISAGTDQIGRRTFRQEQNISAGADRSELLRGDGFDPFRLKATKRPQQLGTKIRFRPIRSPTGEQRPTQGEGARQAEHVSSLSSQMHEE